MSDLVVKVLFCVCLMILGAAATKPTGWVVVLLAVLALLLAVLGFPWGHTH
jgi:hypothetical protein